MALVRELQLGVWLDSSLSESARSDIERLAQLLVDSMADLVMTLAMFETIQGDESARRARPEQALAAWEAEQRRARELADGSLTADEARRQAQTEQWEANGGPPSYQFRRPFIFASAFVAQLALVDRVIGAIAGLVSGSVKADVEAAQSFLGAAVPGAKGVRDSDAHIDERIRGLHHRKHLLPLEGALALRNLSGNRYSTTDDAGSHVEVEISDMTTEIVRAAIQTVFDALPWKEGPTRIAPT